MILGVFVGAAAMLMLMAVIAGLDWLLHLSARPGRASRRDPAHRAVRHGGTAMTGTQRAVLNLSHPENPHAVLGAVDYWTSDDARRVHGDAHRLAVIDALMAAHREAVSGQ